MGNELIRICGFGMLCAVAALLLHGKNGELAMLLRVGGVLVIMGVLATALQDTLGELGALISSSALSTYLTVMLKALGIAILCATCGDVCRECGSGSVAFGVELAGNLLILSLCLPILREILGYATSLLSLG